MKKLFRVAIFSQVQQDGVEAVADTIRNTISSFYTKEMFIKIITSHLLKQIWLIYESACEDITTIVAYLNFHFKSLVTSISSSTLNVLKSLAGYGLVSATVKSTCFHEITFSLTLFP